MTITYAYVIRRTDDERPPDRRTISAGTRTIDARWGADRLAVDLVQEALIKHAYLAGPLLCAVWEDADGGDLTPYLHGADLPEGAERYECGRQE